MLPGAEALKLALIGESEQMVELRRQVLIMSRVKMPVVITGETGTGKEIIAEALHTNGRRRRAAFVRMNCAALTSSLFESELFGYRRGAFTGAHENRLGKFQAANGGTLFLDEIAEIPFDMQAKLLRVLESGEVQQVGSPVSTHVDVQIIAATNRELTGLVSSGQFREDLYYRLAGLHIQVPTLRERGDDIMILANHFARNQDVNPDVQGILPNVLRRAMKYTWPGNVRELRHVIHRAAVMSQRDVIDTLDINIMDLCNDNGVSAVRIPPDGINLMELEKTVILETLRMVNWIQKDAARLLGISTRVMNYKIVKYQIKHRRWYKNRERRDDEMQA